MSTLREIIYDIHERLNAYSDDTRVSEEHIAFLVGNKRNMLMEQAMSRLSKKIPQETIQAVCFTMEVDELCFQDVNTLKSSIAVPPTLQNTGRSDLVKAYPVGSNFVKNFNIIDYSRLPFVGAEQYNSKQIFITVDPDSYLLVYNSDNKHLMLEQIKIEGVFENPEEAYNISCESSDVDFWDVQYPIKAGLLDPLKTQVLQDLLLKYKISKDEINDGEDNAQMQNGRRQKS